MAPLSRVLTRIGGRIRATSLDPTATRRAVQREAERCMERSTALLAPASSMPDARGRLHALVTAMERIGDSFFPRMLPLFPAIMVPTVTSLSKLRSAAERTGLPDADALAMSVLAALPGNVTTEMDLALSDVAAVIRSDATAWGWVAETTPHDLADQYLQGNLPTVAQDAIQGYMDVYGMRGIAEIDLGAPRWRDDPEPLMRTLKSLVESHRPATEARRLHTEAQHRAGRSLRTLMDASTRADARRIRSWARTIRGVFGARETPKFTLIRVFGLWRDHLAICGAALVDAHLLTDPDDIYFLHLDELRTAFDTDWRSIVTERRMRYALEAQRAAVPTVLVSDGRALYPTLSAEGDLAGSGVSPGVVEGVVRVVRNPGTDHLQPGEILVCAGTDPAWTPLFLSAAGLVTEVGGLMTHGSVVAREYGIPAVVGVPGATTRLATGQRIRIDGTRGVIELIEVVNDHLAE